MRRLLAATLLMLATAVTARAQVPYDPNRNQGLGAAAGLASGAGLSYQEILPSALGFRGTILGWKVGDSSFIDLGASAIRVLSDDGERRIYLVGGISYWRWSEDGEPVFDENDNIFSERDDAEDSWSIGAGAGIELPVGARTVASFEGLFTYWAKSGDFLPLPQVAIHYLF